MAMTDMQYNLATVTDIPGMARYRIELFAELTNPQPANRVDVLKSLEQYFSHAIPDKTYVGWLARAEGRFAGMGGFTVREQPGNFRNPGGRTAYIMNMYTVPAYRKQGVCATLLQKLMNTAGEMGIDAFELHASKFGEPIYQKAGFKQHTEPTYRKYGFEWTI